MREDQIDEPSNILDAEFSNIASITNNTPINGMPRP